MANIVFPDEKRFAFTVIDDTDVATLENIEPIYELLAQLGLKTTKTVWPVDCPEGSPDYSTSETLEDPDYLEFVKKLQQQGFEITWHSATMESSKRDRIEFALERFKTIFGDYPRVHANHGLNRENLYWGSARIDQPLLKLLYSKLTGENEGYYLGHIEGSPYWWGDLCEKYIMYARNLTFNDINLAQVNPSMPYRDPERPASPWWFSTSDAEDADAFIELLCPENQQRLEEEGGFCIVSTHFGKEYVLDGEVHPEVKSRLEMLSRRPGWFPTAGELLDWLKMQRKSDILPRNEWRRMQWTWAWDLGVRKFQERRHNK